LTISIKKIKNVEGDHKMEKTPFDKFKMLPSRLITRGRFPTLNYKFKDKNQNFYLII